MKTVLLIALLAILGACATPSRHEASQGNGYQANGGFRDSGFDPASMRN